MVSMHLFFLGPNYVHSWQQQIAASLKVLIEQAFVEQSKIDFWSFTVLLGLH